MSALLLACSTLSGQQIYDLLLKNGRVIDPANHRDGQTDIAVIGNRIVRVAANLPEAHSRVTVDVSGYIVTPGLIDVRFSTTLKPDYNTLPYGVTTAIDAEGAACQHAKVRLLAVAGGKCTDDVVNVAASPATISSGMDASTVLPFPRNLSIAMSIALARGLDANQVIERVTANAAAAIKRPQLGNLSEGSTADIAVLEIQPGKFGFVDASNSRVDATRRFHCVLTVRNGVIVWDSEGLSVPDTLKAGPYTNFK